MKNLIFKNIMNQTFPAFMRCYWHDILLGIVLSSLFFVASYQASKTIPSEIRYNDYFDKWFDADIPRVFENMTMRNEGDQESIRVHPLFMLTTHPIVYLMDKIFGIFSVEAVRMIIGFVAFAWMFVLFSLLRIIGCRRWDTVLFCLLAAVSSASVFWFTVPETFSFGSLSILLALLFVALPLNFMPSTFWFILMNIATFSFVITNWMVGIFVTLLMRPFKSAMHIIVYSFASATLLWGIQKYIYPDVTFFMGEKVDIRNFNIFNPESGGPLYVTSSFLYHTLIMPVIKIGQSKHTGSVMMTQLSFPGSGTAWGLVAVALWTILLFLGIRALFLSKEHINLRIVLGVLLLCQLALHILYGGETFLYSLNFIILFILLIALSSLTKLRKFVITLIIFLIPCVAFNNLSQFHKSKEFLRQEIENNTENLSKLSIQQ